MFAEESVETLLEENFILDSATNRWWLPTPDERERLNDTQALRGGEKSGHRVAGRPCYLDGHEESATSRC